MALLAAYMIRGKDTHALPDYLDSLIAGSIGKAVKPDPKDVAGFQEYFERYKKGLAIEAQAVKSLT
jgi:hypothetical protein